VRKIAAVVLICVGLSGCVIPKDALRATLGNSVKILEEGREQAYVKIFDYDSKTSYEKAMAVLCKMPYVSIYATNSQMIAVYYVNPNTTPVGVFFTPIDAARTQVEVSSPSRSAKEWVARNVFSETVIQPSK
jgi:hypothetical protein